VNSAVTVKGSFAACSPVENGSNKTYPPRVCSFQVHVVGAGPHDNRVQDRRCRREWQRRRDQVLERRPQHHRAIRRRDREDRGQEAVHRRHGARVHPVQQDKTSLDKLTATAGNNVVTALCCHKQVKGRVRVLSRLTSKLSHRYRGTLLWTTRPPAHQCAPQTRTDNQRPPANMHRRTIVST
jgi:hypothetical protein